MKRLKLFLRCYRDHRAHGSSIGESWRCGWAFAGMVLRHGLWEVGPHVRTSSDVLDRIWLFNQMRSHIGPNRDARDQKNNGDELNRDSDDERHDYVPFLSVEDARQIWADSGKRPLEGLTLPDYPLKPVKDR